MISYGRRGTPPRGASLLEQAGHRFVTTIAGHDHEVLLETYGSRIRARVEQDLDCLDLPFPDGEMDRLSVPVFRTIQVGIAFEQTAQPSNIARRCGADCFPDVTSPARPWPKREFGCKFIGSDHPHTSGRRSVDQTWNAGAHEDNFRCHPVHVDCVGLPFHGHRVGRPGLMDEPWSRATAGASRVQPLHSMSFDNATSPAPSTSKTLLRRVLPVDPGFLAGTYCDPEARRDNCRS